MKKIDELTNPDSCMSRAKDDEETFVLLGRDLDTPDTIRYWCKKRIDRGKNTITDKQIVSALEQADRIEKSHNK